MEYPNWFEKTAQHNFEVYLAGFADKRNLRFLQLGAFHGDATLWMLDNILTDETSSLTDVDTWGGSATEGVHDEMNFNDVWKSYIHRIKDYDNVYPSKTSTNHFFHVFEDDGDWWYDFIYIDADHTASAVLDDAVMAWQHLKPGGIMAFDDYSWEHPDGELYQPRPAINFFLWAKQGQFKLIEASSQIWICKL